MLVSELYGAARSRDTLDFEIAADLPDQPHDQAEAGRPPASFGEFEARTIIFHPQHEPFGVFAEPNLDRTLAPPVNPVLCCVCDQLVDDQSQRHCRIIGQLALRGGELDRYILAECLARAATDGPNE